MLPNKIRWAIMGTSPISHTMAKAIQESKTGTLAAVGSRSLQNAKQFAEQHSVPKYYDDYQQLLNDDGIDAVYIGLPNHLHKEFILRAASAKKHILCEKPFTLTAEEAREAIHAVKNAGVFCMEALMYRHHPLTHALQQLLIDKVIGDIKLYQSYFFAHIVDVANATAGGSIRNLGCYPVSLIRLLANAEPVEIQAMGRMNAKNDNQASVMLKFPDEAMAVISAADDLKMRSQLEIFGSEGSLKVITNPWLPELDNNKIIITRDDEPEPREIIISANQSLYSYQIDAAGSSMLNGSAREHAAMSLADSLGNMIVLEEWVNQVYKPCALTASARMTA